MREDFLYRVMKINEFGKDNSKKIKGIQKWKDAH